MVRPALNKKKNHLLARDDVGRAKPTSYDLPKDGFAYGARPGADDEGAADIIRTWAEHVPSADRSHNIDYTRYNKSTLGKASVLRPATSPSGTGKKKSGNTTRGRAQDQVFGMPTRSSTPIEDVIRQVFGQRYEEKKMKEQEEEEQKGNFHGREICTTRASEGHKQGAERRQAMMKPEQKKHFKLKKFANVTSTFKIPRDFGEAAWLRFFDSDFFY